MGCLQPRLQQHQLRDLSRLLRASSNCALKTSKDGDDTTLLTAECCFFFSSSLSGCHESKLLPEAWQSAAAWAPHGGRQGMASPARTWPTTTGQKAGQTGGQSRTAPGKSIRHLSRDEDGQGQARTLAHGWHLSQHHPWPRTLRAATQWRYNSGRDSGPEMQGKAAPLSQKSALDVASPQCDQADSPHGHPREGTTLGCAGSELALSSSTQTSWQCQPLLLFKNT